MFKDKLKMMFNKKLTDEAEVSQGNNKKKIENLVFIVVLLIVTVVVINYIWDGDKKSNKTLTNTSGRQLASSKSLKSAEKVDTDIGSNIGNGYGDSGNEENLEKRLEGILAKINGVGSVQVFLNYSESSETMAMYNENSKKSVTEETDTSGGVKKVEETDSQKEIVYKEDGSSKVPIVKKTVEPKIEGAIITAKGASNINVKTNIIQAVEAATGLATHKIQVFEMAD